MITAGIDVGTRFLKICIVEEGKILSFASREMKGKFNCLYRDTFREALESASREKGSPLSRRSVKRTVSTGYGAHLVKGATLSVNDPLCTSRGAWEHDKNIKTVIDAGGFFVRIITVGPGGHALHCRVNENCAAGSGRFLEMIAGVLGVPFELVSEKVRQSSSPHAITTSCAVFAESDVISEANRGRSVEDILAGVVESIASKTVTLMEGEGIEEPMTLTGGLAAVPSFIEALEKKSGLTIPVASPPEPRKLTAYGAAVIARELRSRGILRKRFYHAGNRRQREINGQR